MSPRERHLAFYGLFWLVTIGVAVTVGLTTSSGGWGVLAGMLAGVLTLCLDGLTS